jgi:hypothetical protein
MSKTLAAGDTVRIQERDIVPADLKSQLYFEHYKGLIGTITKIYPDDTVVVTIDLESLPAEIRKRHNDGSEFLRLDWLGKLSDEARNKLSATEKKLNLRYTVLVAVSDLVPEKALPAPKMEIPSDADSDSAAVRPSSADYEAAEARELARRAGAQ